MVVKTPSREGMSNNSQKAQKPTLKELAVNHKGVLSVNEHFASK